MITLLPPPADSPLYRNLAFPCPVHSFVLGYFIKGFHKEMFFSKKCVEAVEGNKLVYICEFGKIRKMCSQHVIVHVQTQLTCLPSQPFPPITSLSVNSHCATKHHLGDDWGWPCLHMTTWRCWLRNTNAIPCSGILFKSSVLCKENLHPDIDSINLMLCRSGCNTFYLVNNPIQHCLIILNCNLHDVLDYQIFFLFFYQQITFFFSQFKYPTTAYRPVQFGIYL